MGGEGKQTNKQTNKGTATRPLCTYMHNCSNQERHLSKRDSTGILINSTHRNTAVVVRWCRKVVLYNLHGLNYKNINICICHVKANVTWSTLLFGLKNCTSGLYRLPSCCSTSKVEAVNISREQFQKKNNIIWHSISTQLVQSSQLQKKTERSPSWRWCGMFIRICMLLLFGGDGNRGAQCYKLYTYNFLK